MPDAQETEKCGCAIKKRPTARSIYAKNNAVAKDFHDNICHAPVKVIATGKVSEKGGKKVISLTKIVTDTDAK